MADQHYWKETSTFWLDLHGVAYADAEAALRSRIRECVRFGVEQLQVVFGTPDRFEGSIAQALHRVLNAGVPIEPSSVPAEFWTSPETFARRRAFLKLAFAGYLGTKTRMDERSSFSAFRARYEFDPWRKCLCENPYQPLRDWHPVEEVAKRLGSQCSAADVRRLAADEEPSAVRRNGKGEIAFIHRDLLPTLVYRWAGIVRPGTKRRRSPAKKARKTRLEQPAPSLTSRRASQEGSPTADENSEPQAALEDAASPGSAISEPENSGRPLSGEEQGAAEASSSLPRAHAPEAVPPATQTREAGDVSRLSQAESGAGRSEQDENGPRKPTRSDWLSATNEGIVLVEEGRYAEALERFTEALDIAAALGWREQYVSISNLGYVYELIGDCAEAEDWYEEALALAKKNSAPTHPLVQCAEWNVRTARGERVEPRRVASGQPHSPAFDERIVTVLEWCEEASRSYSAADFHSALNQAEAALSACAGLLPENHTIRFSLLMVRCLSLRYLGRLNEAEKGFRQLLSPEWQLERSVAALVLTHLGTCLRLQDRYREAAEAHWQALSLLEEIGELKSWFGSTAWMNLGVALRYSEDYEEAERAYQEALRIEREISPEPTRETAGAMYNLGMLYLGTERLTEAENILREALRIQERILPPDHLDTGNSAYGLGQVLAARGRFKDAIQLLERAVRIRRRCLGDRHPSTLRAIYVLEMTRLARAGRIRP